MVKNSHEIVKKLATTNSRLDKEKILLDAWEEGYRDFFHGLYLAYNPLITFGVKQVPVKTVVETPCPLFTERDFFGFSFSLSERHLTGHAARDAIISAKQGSSTDDWNGFYRLVLLKDMKCGITESTINKVLKKIGTDEAKEYIIPEFPYQRCCLPKNTDLNKFSWKTGVISQEKKDGMFVNVNVYSDGSVSFFSRNGRLFPEEGISNLILETGKTLKKSTQTHGELIVKRDGKILPRELGNGLLNSVSQGEVLPENEKIVLVVWDQIPLESVVSKGVCDVPYEQRLNELFKQIGKTLPDDLELIDTEIVYSLDEATTHYKKMLSLGYEGTILKEPSAGWKDGTSKFCVKFKTEVSVDLEVIGFNEGKGKNESTFGSLIVKSSDGLLEVGVSGFSDELRKQIWDKREEVIGKIVEVKSNAIMKPTPNNEKYSLFLPVFVCFRDDKNVADDLERVQAQFEKTIF